MSRRSPTRARGFTLIELLLATVLLAAGLALAFATVKSVMAVSARGEAMASRSERVRAVEAFLRRRLASAMPVLIGEAADTGEPQLFIGEPQRLRFVADVPDYLGRGGPYLHDIDLSGSSGSHRLRIALTLLQAGHQIPEQPVRPAEILAEGLQAVRFRYRGLDPDSGRLGEWQDQWQAPGRMPLLVSIEIVPLQGAAWPPLTVALPQYGRPPGSAR